MIVGLASKNYEFMRRFYDCAQRNSFKPVCFCGPAWNEIQLRQMVLYNRPDAIIFEVSDPWEGSSFNRCRINYSNMKKPIIVHFTYTRLESLELSAIRRPSVNDGFGEKDEQNLNDIIEFCTSISNLSKRIVEKGENQKKIEFRCITASVMEKRGVAPTTKGYHYILDVIEDLYMNSANYSKKEEIYNRIARANNTTVLRVEKAVKYTVSSVADSSVSDRKFVWDVYQESRAIVDAAGFVV